MSSQASACFAARSNTSPATPPPPSAPPSAPNTAVASAGSASHRFTQLAMASLHRRVFSTQTSPSPRPNLAPSLLPLFTKVSSADSAHSCASPSRFVASTSDAVLASTYSCVQTAFVSFFTDGSGLERSHCATDLRPGSTSRSAARCARRAVVGDIGVDGVELDARGLKVPSSSSSSQFSSLMPKLLMDAIARGPSGLCAMPMARASCARMALANSPSVRAMHLARSSRARARALSAPGMEKFDLAPFEAFEDDISDLSAKKTSAEARSSSHVIHVVGSAMTRWRSASCSACSARFAASICASHPSVSRVTTLRFLSARSRSSVRALMGRTMSRSSSS